MEPQAAGGDAPAVLGPGAHTHCLGATAGAARLLEATEQRGNDDNKRSMILPGIWRGVLLKSVGEKEGTSADRSMGKELLSEEAQRSQPATLNYSKHLVFGETADGQEEPGGELRKQDTPCMTYNSYHSRSWPPHCRRGRKPSLTNWTTEGGDQ